MVPGSTIACFLIPFVGTGCAEGAFWSCSLRKHRAGDVSGLVGFNKALDEEEIHFVEEKLPTLRRGDRESIPSRACTVICTSCILVAGVGSSSCPDAGRRCHCG